MRNNKREFKDITKSTWDKITKDYINFRKSGESMNELIEIPAMKELVGNLKGLKVLDAGCGFGDYSFWAFEQGVKEVVGVDISDKMINAAKERSQKKGVNIEFIQSDLSDLGVFNDNYFDLIMSSIVISYFDDLNKYFKEFARVLKKKGRFVFSDVHPIRLSGWIEKDRGKYILQIKNYLDARKVETSDLWKNEKGEYEVIRSYYYPLSDIIRALKNTGFLIEDINEPKPLKRMKSVLPKKYSRLCQIPLFILISAIKK